MWGGPPFTISSNEGIDVRNLSAARDWYKAKLGLKDMTSEWEDDSGRPFADLGFSGDGEFLRLVQLPTGGSPQTGHVILFARNLEKAHQWLAGRGVIIEPITADSGENHFFLFRDLDGNAIEVCVESG